MKRRILLLMLLLAAPGLYGAAVTHFECEQVSAQTHTGNTSFSTEMTCSSSNFVAGKTYILFASAQIGGSNANDNQDLYEVRLAHGAGPTAFTDSLLSYEPPVAGTEENGWFYFQKYTVPSTPVNIVVQARVSDSATTVTLDTIIVNGICLDCELTTNDWKFAEATADQELTPGTKSGASITWTPSVTGNWLVVANCSIFEAAPTENNTACWISGASENVPRSEVESEASPDQTMTWTLGRVYALTGSTEYTFAVQAAAENNQTPDNTLLSTRIFALRLDAFAQHAHEYQTGPIDLTSGSFVEVGNIDPVVAVGGDWLLLGFGILADNATGATFSFGQFTIGGTVTPVGIDDKQVTIGWDVSASELLPLAIQSMVNLAASTQDIDFDWKSDHSDDDATRVTLLGLSMELAPVATPILSDAAVIEGFYPDPFDIQSQSLPDGGPEEVYPGAQFVALNGNPPHTWAVSSGALPDGLSLSSGGALTGTPAMGEGGTHNFTVEATDEDGGLAHRDFSIVVQSPPHPVQQPWERNFTPLRTHYVSTTGTGNGDIGTPESFATARGHAVPGDRHILRGGTYAGTYTLTANGTAANPIEWKCYIDANGDPERAIIDGTIRLDGDWTWLNCLDIGDKDDSLNVDRAAVDMRSAGVALINSQIVRHRRATALDAFNYASGMVIYGNTFIENGMANTTTAPRHNTYTQNIFSQFGWKYFIQNISLDTPPCASCPNSNSNNLFQINFSNSAGGRGTGFHLEGNVYQNGRINMSQHSGFTTGNPPFSRIRIRNVWIDSLIGPTMWWRIGDRVPVQFQITDSLIRNSRIDFRGQGIWGANDACPAFTYPEPFLFTGNRVYDPDGTANYLNMAVSNYDSSCNRNAAGAAKILDNTVWNNNDYRRSAGAGTFSLHANGSGPIGHNLAAWRTATDAARETGGGTAFDAASTESTTLPTTDEVECFANFYQPNWGWCRAINWDGNGSVTLSAAEVQKIVGNGKTYKVRNVRGFYGTPLESGTYTTGVGIVVSPLPGDMVNAVLLVYITSQP